VKYCVTIEIRNSKLNLVIIKPPRLLSNLGGSLHSASLYTWPSKLIKSSEQLSNSREGCGRLVYKLFYEMDWIMTYETTN
ncbi:hypothetical protein LOSG293_070530, partial [Secundilactobacillus oryzae JCM 18671]